jgi:hypothetical protein
MLKFLVILHAILIAVMVLALSFILVTLINPTNELGTRIVSTLIIFTLFIMGAGSSNE